jgi:predicted RNA binding protein YcfA (HicA-like mRNA interferase family)
MSSRKKLRTKLENFASDHNWTLAEAELVLSQHGFSNVGGEGSHRVYSHPQLDQPVVLAAHGKAIKSGYVRRIRQALEDLPS